MDSAPTAHAAPEDTIDRPLMRETTDRLVARSLRPLALLSAVLYAAVAVLRYSEGGASDPLGAAAVASAAVCATLAIAWMRHPPPVRHANAAAAILLFTMLGHVAIALLLTQPPMVPGSVAAVSLMASLTILSYPLMLAIVLTGGALTAAAMVTGYSAHPFRQLILLGAMLGISLLVHHVRYQMTRTTARARERERRQNAALRQSEARYRGLFEGIPVGMYRTTPDGRILDMNLNAARCLGFPNRESMRDVHATELYMDPAQRDEWLRRIETDGIVRGWQVQLRRPDGEVVWIRDSAHAVRDADGRTRYYEGAMEDITEQKVAEAQVAETRRQVAHSEKLSALGTLVAGVAHEINNPLTYMQGNLELNQMDLQELLDDPTVPEHARERLRNVLALEQTALTGIERVSHITTSLKRVARASDGQRTSQDLNRILESVITVASAQLKDDVHVEIELDAERRVQCDASELAQVFLNLVLNAADAVRERDDAHIRLSTKDERGHVIVEVSDNGRGIPPEEQDRIFTPFHTTKPQGTGLGLSVSYGIVAAHGGHLTFRTGPDGTTFRVALPNAECERSGTTAEEVVGATVDATAVETGGATRSHGAFEAPALSASQPPHPEASLGSPSPHARHAR